jgi:excisionase family DNA binding protein
MVLELVYGIPRGQDLGGAVDSTVGETMSLPSESQHSDPVVPQAPDVMTVREVAEYLRIKPARVYELATAKKLPGSKVGRQWRFRRIHVIEFLDRTLNLNCRW